MARAALPAWAKPAIHLIAASPLLWLAASWAELLFLNPVSLRLSAEPVAYTHNLLGLTALRLLLVTLAVTPIRKLSGWLPVMQMRRMLGLWAFAYAALHLGFFLAMELDFSPALLWKEAMKRPFILFGLTAFTLLLPLALTSTRAAIRRLGGGNWRALHRLVYPAAIAASIHFIYRVKGFQPEPWIYLLILLALLGIRFMPSRRSASRAPAPDAGA